MSGAYFELVFRGDGVIDGLIGLDSNRGGNDPGQLFWRATGESEGVRTWKLLSISPNFDALQQVPV